MNNIDTTENEFNNFIASFESAFKKCSYKENKFEDIKKDL